VVKKGATIGLAWFAELLGALEVATNQRSRKQPNYSPKEANTWESGEKFDGSRPKWFPD
jgi:hypothetical protein